MPADFTAFRFVRGPHLGNVQRGVFPLFCIYTLPIQRTENTNSRTLIVPQSHTFVKSDCFRLRPNPKNLLIL